MSHFKLNIFAFLLLSLAIQVLPHAKADEGDPDEENITVILWKVGQTLGKPLEGDKVFGLKSSLEKIFSELAEGLKKAKPREYVYKYKVYIIDSKVENAFIAPLKRAGVNEVEMHVFVTTGFFGTYYDLLKKEKNISDLDFQKKMARVTAGVLAHELGHALDKLEGSQLEEVKADASAMSILREAGYPLECFYETLLYFQELERKERPIVKDPLKVDEEVAKSTLSTHPETSLRLTMQRILLTLQRYYYGTYEPIHQPIMNRASANEIGELLNDPSRDQKELIKVYETLSKGQLTEPNNLAEAALLLDNIIKEALKKGRGDHHYRLGYTPDWDIRFNTAVTQLLEILSLTGNEQPVAVQNAIKILSRALWENGLEPATREELEYLFKHHPQQSLRKLPSYYQQKERMSSYRFEKYLRWVDKLIAPQFELKTLEADNREHFFKRMETINYLSRIVPDHLIYERYGPKIARLVKSYIHRSQEPVLGDSSIMKIHHANENEDRNVGLAIGFAALLHEKVLPTLTLKDRVKFYQFNHELTLKEKVESSDFDFAFFTLKPQSLDAKKNRKRTQILNRVLQGPFSQGLQQDLITIAGSLWKNRAELALFDILSPSGRQTDWQKVGKLLSLSDAEVRKGLHKAMIEYTQTRQYAELLLQIAEANTQPWGKGQQWWLYGKQGEPSLLPFLSGDRNPMVIHNPELHRFARTAFGGSYYQNGKRLEQDLFQSLSKQWKDTPHTENFDMFLQHLTKSEQDLFGFYGGTKILKTESIDLEAPLKTFSRYGIRAIAKAVDSSKLDFSTKKDLLFNVFLEQDTRLGHSIIGNRIHEWTSNVENAELITHLLLKYQVVEQPSEILPYLYKRTRDIDMYLAYLPLVSPLLASEVEQISRSGLPDEIKYEKLLLLCKRCLDPKEELKRGREKLGVEYHKFNTTETRQFKNQTAKAFSKLKGLSIEQKFSFIEALTGLGPVPESDTLFLSLMDQLPSDPPPEIESRLFMILKNGLISSHLVQLKVFELAAKKQMEELRKRPIGTELTDRQFADFFDRLRESVPLDSAHKDAFLEKLAWQLRINNEQQLRVIQDLKSSNIKRVNPHSIRAASGLVNYFSHLDLFGRLQMMRFLTEPNPDDMPVLLRRKLRDVILSNPPGKTDQNLEIIANAAISQAVVMLRDLKPMERIPLFENLLSTGNERSLVKDPAFPENIIHNVLGYKPGSAPEILLKAYLAISPEYERTVVLSHLMSTVSDPGDSIKKIFEAFQSVGIKAGQTVSIWKLLGEEIAHKTQDLKDHAAPLDKYEIMTLLKERMGSRYHLIDYPIALLGSASVKVACLVQLKDGRQTVAMLRRPHALEQVDSNIRIGLRYIDELERYDLKIPSQLTRVLLDALKQQIRKELDFTEEAEHVQEAVRMYAAIGKEMNLKGWSIVVPKLTEGMPITEDLIFIDAAKGAVSYKDLDEAEREAVGPLIAQSKLKLLFRTGWFNPDPHAGNFLVDRKNKTLYPIDFGQVESFGISPWPIFMDERANLAAFLASTGQKDIAGIIEYGEKLSMKGSQQADHHGLRADLSTLLSPQTPLTLQDQIIKVIASFSERGLPIRPNIIWAFKGLMTLFSEHYVPEETFKSILAEEIGRVHLIKPMLGLSRLCGNALGGLKK